MTTTNNKILVLYVFHEYTNSVKYFIENAIFYDDNIDFIIIVNNDTFKFDYNFKYNNVKVLIRENKGYDFGAWSDALLINDLYLNYDKFIFINSSVKGPILSKNFQGKWIDNFINGLNNDIKLYGTSINNINDPLNRAHVQSYSFCIDIEALKFLINEKIFTMDEYINDKERVIEEKEILMSRKIIENNWNIGCFMEIYKNVDFRFINKKPKDYNNNLFHNNLLTKKNRNVYWNDEELMFVKNYIYAPTIYKHMLRNK